MDRINGWKERLKDPIGSDRPGNEEHSSVGPCCCNNSPSADLAVLIIGRFDQQSTGKPSIDSFKST